MFQKRRPGIRLGRRDDMKVKIVIVFLLIVAAIVVMNTSAIKGFFLSEPKQEITAQSGTLDYYVQKAKAEGKSEIGFITGIPEGPSDLPWIEATAKSRVSIVRAQIIQAKTYPVGFDPDGDGPVSDLVYSQMVTWYKLRLLETLQHQDKGACNGCVDEMVPPQDMLPVQNDELLTAAAGGTLERDGILLKSGFPDFPQLTVGDEYVIALVVGENRLAHLRLAQYGIYKIANDQLNPIFKDDILGYREEIQKLYANSLSKLRISLVRSPETKPTDGKKDCHDSRRADCESKLNHEWDSKNCICKKISKCKGCPRPT
jgi:hypothetical protein